MHLEVGDLPDRTHQALATAPTACALRGSDEPNGSLYGNPPPLGCYFTALGGSCTISPPAPVGPATGSLTLTMS